MGEHVLSSWKLLSMGGSEHAVLNEGHGEELNFFRRYEDGGFFFDVQMPFNLLPLPIAAPSFLKWYKNLTGKILSFLQDLNPIAVVKTLLKLEKVIWLLRPTAKLYDHGKRK